MISGEAERLTSLVANLLDLSRLESGSIETHAEPSAVDEVLDAVLGEPVAARGAPRRRSSTRTCRSSRPTRRSSSGRLSNLLENGVTALGRRAGGDTCQCPGQPRLVVRITDHGPGHRPADDLERIFEPFYRAPGSPGRRAPGWDWR